MASLNPEVLKVVQQSPLGRTLGRERMFFNVQSAVERYEQIAAAGPGNRRLPAARVTTARRCFPDCRSL